MAWGTFLNRSHFVTLYTEGNEVSLFYIALGWIVGHVLFFLASMYRQHNESLNKRLQRHKDHRWPSSAPRSMTEVMGHSGIYISMFACVRTHTHTTTVGVSFVPPRKTYRDRKIKALWLVLKYLRIKFSWMKRKENHFLITSKWKT